MKCMLGCFFLFLRCCSVITGFRLVYWKLYSFVFLLSYEFCLYMKHSEHVLDLIGLSNDTL